MSASTMPAQRIGQPGGKGGYGGPNTAGPGGQGRDYNGNARGSNMPGEFFIGGPPRAVGGPAPIPGGRPAPGDLYRPQPSPIFDDIMPSPAVLPPEGQPGNFRPGNRFMPGRGMVPPAGGRIGNPRQVNPGQGPMRPGMPAQPVFRDIPGYGGGKGGFGGPRAVPFNLDPQSTPIRGFEDGGFGRPGDVNVGEVNYPGY